MITVKTLPLAALTLTIPFASAAANPVSSPEDLRSCISEESINIASVAIDAGRLPDGSEFVIRAAYDSDEILVAEEYFYFDESNWTVTILGEYYVERADAWMQTRMEFTWDAVNPSRSTYAYEGDISEEEALCFSSQVGGGDIVQSGAGTSPADVNWGCVGGVLTAAGGCGSAGIACKGSAGLLCKFGALTCVGLVANAYDKCK